jgi:hypothetical protein
VKEITPERQVLYDKYMKAVGDVRKKLAVEFTRSQLEFLIRQLEEPNVDAHSIANALRDIAALITSPMNTAILYAGTMPPQC